MTCFSGDYFYVSFTIADGGISCCSDVKFNLTQQIIRMVAGIYSILLNSWGLCVRMKARKCNLYNWDVFRTVRTIFGVYFITKLFLN